MEGKVCESDTLYRKSFMIKIFDVPMLNWQNKPIQIYINIYKSIQNLLWNIQDPNLIHHQKANNISATILDC